MTHIRTLLSHETPAYLDHLLRLGPEARRLRFGYPIDDDGVRTFVERLASRNNRILVHHDPALQLIGAVHIAFNRRESAELALSVDAPHRGQGIGRDLLERGVLWAGNRGIRRLHLYFLGENQGMRRLARAAGMEITVDGGECEASLVPPAPTPTSLLTEMTLEGQAVVDYLRRAHRRPLTRPLLRPRAA